MIETCPFTNDCGTPCPMGEDIIEVSGACSPDGYGEVCAPVAGYGALVGQYDKLKTADAVNPIVGTFTFDTVPVGYPPEDIREHWVGVEVPVRQPERLVDGEIAVAPVDAFLSLLRAGKLEAASWFMASGLQLDYLAPTWVFQATEGTHNELPESLSSVDFYGATVASEVKVVIEDTDPNLTGGDLELPPVEVQADILMMQDRMDMFPDSNHAGTPGMLALELWKSEKISSLATFESWLRQMHTRVHFVAVPLDFYGDANPGTTTYMECREGDPEYTTWIGVNGDDEAQEMLEHLGLSEEENLQRLETTGMIMK